jgi:predicted TIM-barrel fold metal-dependent hydrolase
MTASRQRSPLGASVREDWLARTAEQALEPDLPICDPHHHLWSRPGDRYLLEEILRDAGSGHAVHSTVFVECGSAYAEHAPEPLRPVGETEFVQRIAARAATGQAGPTAVAAGIVGHADLCLGAAVQKTLEAHLSASGNRFCGIRHSVARDESPAIRRSRANPPPGLLLDARFREGFGRLEKLGLSFDAWLYHPQIPELTDLARAFPGVTIILDHVGGPLGVGPYAGRRDEVFAEWKRSIGALAECPNVAVKLGGLAMPVNGFGWHEREAPPGSEELAAASAPWYLECIEHFGVDRCMFESNFPVDKVSCSYLVLWNSFKRLTRKFSASERAALFCDTAVRVYGLDESPTAA